MNGKLVYGVGTYEKGKYLATKVGNGAKEYSLWMAMLSRCYSERVLLKHPTYSGCTVSENFKNFQFFAEWCNNQVGFGLKRYELDKDLICSGNKQYNEDCCTFVPKEINLLLTDRGGARGENPLGVSYHKLCRNYRAYIGKYGKLVDLGGFDTPEEAFNVYRKAKEDHVHNVAEEYRDSIDIGVYNNLITWKLE